MPDGWSGVGGGGGGAGGGGDKLGWSSDRSGRTLVDRDAKQLHGHSPRSAGNNSFGQRGFFRQDVTLLNSAGTASKRGLFRLPVTPF